MGHKGKKISLVALTPTNRYIGLLYFKNLKKLKFSPFLADLSLFLTKKQVGPWFLIQFDVVRTRRWSKTIQRPQIPLIWYLWIENGTIRREIMTDGLEIFWL